MSTARTRVTRFGCGRAFERFSGAIPFGWCEKLIPLSAKTRFASYPCFSVPGEKWQS